MYKEPRELDSQPPTVIVKNFNYLTHSKKIGIFEN